MAAPKALESLVSEVATLLGVKAPRAIEGTIPAQERIFVGATPTDPLATPRTMPAPAPASAPAPAPAPPTTPMPTAEDFNRMSHAEFEQWLWGGAPPSRPAPVNLEAPPAWAGIEPPDVGRVTQPRQPAFGGEPGEAERAIASAQRASQYERGGAPSQEELYGDPRIGQGFTGGGVRKADEAFGQNFSLQKSPYGSNYSILNEQNQKVGRISYGIEGDDLHVSGMYSSQQRTGEYHSWSL